MTIKMPEPIFDRIRQLAYTLPYKMGYKYMGFLEVMFEPPKCDLMRFVLPLHPFMFRTMGDVPDAAISDGSLTEIVKDHVNKLDTQVHVYFNETNGQFWLKPEHQVVPSKEEQS